MCVSWNSPSGNKELGPATKNEKAAYDATTTTEATGTAAEDAGTAIRAKSTAKSHCIYLGEEEEI